MIMSTNDSLADSKCAAHPGNGMTWHTTLKLVVAGCQLYGERGALPWLKQWRLLLHAAALECKVMRHMAVILDDKGDHAGRGLRLVQHNRHFLEGDSYRGIVLIANVDIGIIGLWSVH